MSFENTLDKIHESAVKNRFLQLFTIFVRGILAFGFFPPGLKKVLHQPFTILPDSNPVGHYFNALYNTGFYYEFIGWGQVIAAVLLIFPRTAHLGALTVFPDNFKYRRFDKRRRLCRNVADHDLDVSGFAVSRLLGLRPYQGDFLYPANATKLMLLSMNTFGFLFSARSGGMSVGIIFYSIGLGNFSNYLNVSLILAAAGLVFGIFMAIHHRFMRVGDLEMKAGLK